MLSPTGSATVASRLGHFVSRGIDGNSPGVFSSARCDALQQYQQHTSVSRCLVVCIMTPFPALVYTIAVEALLPLAPIADGWDASPNLMLRFFFVTSSTAFCAMDIMRSFVPNLPIKPRQFVFPALVTGLLHTACNIGIIVLSVFPLPFLSTLTAGLFTMFFCLSLVVFVGVKPFVDIPDLRLKLTLYIAQLVILNGLVVAYPAYGAFYRTLDGVVQTGCIAIPILLKLLAKRLMVKVIRALSGDDIVPALTQFSVELMHSLFVTTCMQTTSNPIRVVVVVVLFDYLPLALAYREIHGLFFRRRGPRSVRQIIPTAPASPAIAHHPSTNAASAGRQRPLAKLRSRSTARVQMSQALYACENHLLMEYIECVIPCLYGVYVAVLFHLPNARYYDTMDTMKTPESLQWFLASIGILVTLQIMSVVAFSVLLSRRVLPSVSCLHQLSYVLETQAEMVQCWMLTWVPFCILSTVQHGGMDFTLRFEWLHHNSTLG